MGERSEGERGERRRMGGREWEREREREREGEREREREREIIKFQVDNYVPASKKHISCAMCSR